MKKISKIIPALSLYLCLSFSSYSAALNTQSEAQPSDNLLPRFNNFPTLSMTKYGYTVDKNAMRSGAFRYLGSLRKRHEITIDEQGFFRYQGNLFHTDATWRWVMDTDGRMYGLPITLDTDLYHSSLVGKQWPFCAGTLTARDGFIVSLTNHSGHFKPNNQRLKAV